MAEQRYNPNGRRPANGSRNPNAGRRPAPAPNGRRPAPKKRKKKSAVSAPLVGLLLLAVAGIGGGIWLIHAKGKDGLNTNSNTPPTADVSMTDTTGAVTTADSEVTYTTADTITLMQTTVTTVTTEAPGKVTGIKLSFYEAVMKVGDDTVMPLVTMEPADAKDVSEKWESSNNAVATVDNIGRIKPVGVGNCTVRVTSVSNPKIYAEVKVKVAAPAVTTTVSAAGTTVSGATAEPAVTYTTAVGADGKRTDIEVKDG
ncbi:MAG: Ig-like domain-containing protein, partial [Oscillospiraceae bacterium]|nr:Ig-like domain-containing protein [Oscillospiraceae bacterium]